MTADGEGDIISRIMVIEFDEKDVNLFDDILKMLKSHPSFERLQFSDEPVLSLPGLEIYPDRRKIFRNRREIDLTAKEYDLLCLLVENRGRVLTYEQIYEQVWHEDGLGNESNAVGCHVRNLREKLYAAAPDSPFSIRCIREVGYCLEVDKSKHKSE